MFTGIIEEIGTVKSIRRGTKSIVLEIQAGKVLEGTVVGDSIATNGVCLTVTTMTDHSFTADVMPETVNRTSLSALKPGSMVNLERALTLQTRLGGHIVSGHVDGTGRIIQRTADDNAVWLWIECAPQIMRYIIEKGSITIQGVSLTVAKVSAQGSLPIGEGGGRGRGSFAVSLIPHTQAATTLHKAKVGDVMNLENDVIAKYVERLMAGSQNDNQEEKINLYRDFMMRA